MLRRIERLPQGLAAGERAMMEATKAELRADIAAMLRAQQQLAARDSSALALFLTGEAANMMLRPDIALPALAASSAQFAVTGGASAQGHVVQRLTAHHLLGEYDREMGLLNGKRAAFPRPTIFRARQLVAFAGLHQSAEAVAVADTLLRQSTDSIAYNVIAVVRGGEEFRVHGDSVTSQRLFNMVVTWFAAHPEPRSRPPTALSSGIAFLATGSPDSAASQFATLARDSANLGGAGFLGLSAIAKGDRVRAVAIADSLGALKRTWLFGEHTFWRAVILGALGRPGEAVQLLRRAHREGQSMLS